MPPGPMSRAALCGATNDFQRCEAGLAQQLQLLDESKPRQVVQKARIVTGRHQAAAVLVLVDELHPDAVVLAPGHLALSGPVEPEGSVVQRIGSPVIPQGR